jgi:hypothetical protein
MMHYSVSLRPFVATVAVKPSAQPRSRPQRQGRGSRVDRNPTFEPAVVAGLGLYDCAFDPHDLRPILFAEAPADLRPGPPQPQEGDGTGGSAPSRGGNVPSFRSGTSPSGGGADGDGDGDGDSPIICSPQSFPPTPRSRKMVLARGSQFSDDVVFLARDRLRIHDGLESGNERTREMAWALKEGKRLAIFDGNGVNGIELTCGQHIATKVGNVHYASVRCCSWTRENIESSWARTVNWISHSVSWSIDAIDGPDPSKLLRVLRSDGDAPPEPGFAGPERSCDVVDRPVDTGNATQYSPRLLARFGGNLYHGPNSDGRAMVFAGRSFGRCLRIRRDGWLSRLP